MSTSIRRYATPEHASLAMPEPAQLRKRELNNLERWLSLGNLTKARTEAVIPIEQEVARCVDGITFKELWVVYFTVEQIKIVNCPCSLYELVKTLARGSLGNNYVIEPKDIQALSDRIEYI